MEKKDSFFWGDMERPSAHGKVQGLCGDTMEFFLKLDGVKITEVKCSSTGCGASAMCAIETAKIVYEKNLGEALCISPGDVIRKIRNIPDDHLHCSILAVSTLYRAIADYLISGKPDLGVRGERGLP